MVDTESYQNLPILGILVTKIFTVSVFVFVQ